MCLRCFRMKLLKSMTNRPQQTQIKISSAAVTISPGSVFKLPVVIPKDGTNVKWSFMVKDYSCWFGISSDEEESSPEYLVIEESPIPNTETAGSVIVEEAGTIYLIWDNSSSWIRSRTVIYSLTLDIPNNTIQDKQKSSVYLSLIILHN